MVAPTSPQSPREQILDAVITCIEKYGIDNLTTRKIAEEAGTNIASINYYFRSKDLAVEEALSLALKNSTEDIEAIVAEDGRSFEQTLETMLAYLMEGSLRFPGLTVAHMYPVLIEKRVDTIGALMFRRTFDLLAGRAARDLPGKSQETVRLALAQVLSAAMFSVIAPGLFMPMTPIDINAPDGPEKLAHTLTRMFMCGL